MAKPQQTPKPTIESVVKQFGLGKSQITAFRTKGTGVSPAAGRALKNAGVKPPKGCRI